MSTTEKLESLLAQIREEAQREEFSLDHEVYQTAGRDPWQPILFAGDLDSPVAFFARDLGRDEVKSGQPLYGAAGSLVRRGIYQTVYGAAAGGSEDLQKAADQVALTNTVPYKPLGNKAYPVKVKERFRPFLEKLLVCYWQGQYIIPLGSEALKWFAPYAAKGQVVEFSKNQQRFTLSLEITMIACDFDGIEHQKQVTLAPLPHPSPLNQKYYALFPQMLLERLATVTPQLRRFAGIA